MTQTLSRDAILLWFAWGFFMGAGWTLAGVGAERAPRPGAPQAMRIIRVFPRNVRT